MLLEQNTEQLMILRCNESKTGIRVESHHPIRTFDSYQAMSKFCVELFLEYSPVVENRYLENGTSPPEAHAYGETISPFLLNVASHIVAKTTRRGNATLMLYSDSYDSTWNQYLMKHKLSGEGKISAANMTPIYHDSVPPDALILLYVGNNALDGPFAYRKDDQGYHLYWDDVSPTYAVILPF